MGFPQLSPSLKQLSQGFDDARAEGAFVPWFDTEASGGAFVPEIDGGGSDGSRSFVRSTARASKGRPFVGSSNRSRTFFVSSSKGGSPSTSIRSLGIRLMKLS